MIKDHKRLKAIYQGELAELLTGRRYKTILQRMKRNKWTLAKTIKIYLNIPTTKQ